MFINESSQNQIDSISSIILLKNEDLLYGAHNSIYCINFNNDNLEYNVINIIHIKEKNEIYHFFQMNDEKIICTTNSIYFIVIHKTIQNIYQIILNLIDINLVYNGIYEINRYIIFINKMRNIQFYDNIHFSLIKKLDLSNNLNNNKKENLNFKNKLCLNNIIMGINDNLIAISTLGNGILIINIIKFILIKKIMNIDFTCWIKLNDGSFITCEYTDNKNLIRMEQWDISENGKEWNIISKKSYIHDDYVYSICIDNKNNIYTSGNDLKLKCFEKQEKENSNNDY